MNASTRMLLPETVIEATRRRVKGSETERLDTKRLIAQRRVAEADTPERLRKRVARLTEQATLPGTTGAPVANELGFRNASELSGASKLALERVLGGNDLLAGRFLPIGAHVRRTVCRVEVRDDTRRLGYGTGFLVSPRLLLTNNHVLPDRATARFSVAEFEFEEDATGNLPATFRFRLDPDACYITSDQTEGLDYSLVAIAPASDPNARGEALEIARLGYNRLIADEGKIVKGEPINIIQHPSGEPRQLAIRENRLLGLLPDWLHYETDTAPGSSGSPLYNRQWEVVGLHHSGVPATDEQGRWLSTDGGVWSEEMGDARVKWIANEGARISRVVRDVDRQLAEGSATGRDAAALVDELRSAPPPFWLQPGRIEARPAQPDATTAGAGGGQNGRGAPTRQGGSMSQIASNGAVQISVATHPDGTVQLQIVVNPGAAVGSGSVTTAPPSTGATVGTAVDGGAAIAEAVAEAERFSDREYYPAATDKQDRDRYYTGVDWGASPGDLYRALSRLVIETHDRNFSYSPARRLYPWVDRHPDGGIVSVYTNEKYASATELIRAELQREQEFLQKVAELTARRTREGGFSLGAFEAEVQALEAQLAYNCEHVVPQSWFQKKEPMRGDLHHLFACQSRCNSARGNTPYWDFPGWPTPQEASPDCGKSEAGKFEPRHGKGAVARATLYFLLRYPRVIGDRASELQSERLEILKRWAKENAITEWERHRNRAIFEAQGNRNPLIDLADLFPNEYADRLDGIDFVAGFG